MYRLHKETPDSFHVQHPDGRIVEIPKRGAPKALLAAVKHLPAVEAPKLAEGGDPEVVDPEVGPLHRTPLGSGLVHEVVGGLEEGARHVPFALGLGLGPPPPSATELAATPSGAKPAILASGEAAPGAAPPPSPGAPGPQAGAAAEQGAGAALAFPQLPAYPSGPIEAGVRSMVQTGREGAELQAEAQAQQAKELTTIYQQQQTELGDLRQRWQEDHATTVREWDAARTDYASARVDPTRFWNSRTSSQKLSAVVGMILGGIGSGLTGQPNAALAVIDRAIDRDVEAQKIDMEKKGNLVGMLHQKVGDVDQAAAMAKMYLYADVANRVALAGARAGTAQAQATAKLLESHLQEQALGPLATITNGKYQAELQRYGMIWQQRMMQYAMSQNRGGGGGSGYIPSSANPPMLTEPSLKGIGEQRKDANERRVDLPGIGAGAHTYAKTPEQAKEVRTALTSYDEIEGGIRRLTAIAKANPFDINRWGSQAREQFNVEHGALNLAMNRLMQQQRFTHEENSIYGTMIANPVKFLIGEAGEANLKAITALIQRKRMAEYQGQLGIDTRLFQRPPETPVATAR